MSIASRPPEVSTQQVSVPAIVQSASRVWQIGSHNSRGTTGSQCPLSPHVGHTGISACNICGNGSPFPLAPGSASPNISWYLPTLESPPARLTTHSLRRSPCHNACRSASTCSPSSKSQTVRDTQRTPTYGAGCRNHLHKACLCSLSGPLS